MSCSDQAGWSPSSCGVGKSEAKESPEHSSVGSWMAGVLSSVHQERHWVEEVRFLARVSGSFVSSAREGASY